MVELLAKAPPWAVLLFWGFAALFAAIIYVAVPKLKAAITRVAPPPQPDSTMRIIGGSLATGLDGVKVANDVERIADAVEDVAASLKALAKMEEQGTARTLERVVTLLGDLDRKVEGHGR